jgi:hypothetical protein
MVLGSFLAMTLTTWRGTIGGERKKGRFGSFDDSG